jgi:4-amino-4-deoxy-L-arabinose transferase-like glycosyltransferase
LRSRWLIAAAIIALLFTLQSLRHVGHGPWGVDGSYYMVVARHVAEGDGLLTSVCVYDQGLRTLPAPTNIYPLWPLLLGSAARVMPLEAAATFVPRLFFVLDLVLLFILATRIGANGYLALLLLGLSPPFFSSTCYPYTEGLALFCTFAALIVFGIASDRGETLHYGLAGILAGLAFLTRSQMLFLSFGIGAVLLVLVVRRRARWTAFAAYCAGFAVTVLPWIIHLATFVRPFSLSAVVGMYSNTPGLPPYDQHVITSGGVSYIADRLSGLLVMFNPFSPMSFVESFGWAALLVPIAIVDLIARRRWTGGIAAAATAVSGALMCGILLEAHNRFFLEWLFGYRHGLPFILLLIVAIALLNGRYARVVVLVLVIASVFVNIPRVVAFATAPAEPWPSPAETQMAQWLERNDPNAIVLSTNAQVLSVASRANFRWAACEQSSDDVIRVLRLVRTDYVAVYEQEQRCPFTKGLGRAVTPLVSFGAAPNRIMLLKVRR